MPKSLALIIQSIESPPSPIAKQLEARDFSVHLSRTVDEAERVFSAFPADQIKFVFSRSRSAEARTGPVFSIGYAPRHRK